MLRLILIFTILLLFSNVIIAEKTDAEKEVERKIKEAKEDHRKNLLEQLLSPIAIERLSAAIELQSLITQKELEKWFYGYDTRYRENNILKIRRVEPDWLILTSFLSGGWPIQADFLQDGFLTIKGETLNEKQYLYVFAGYSFTHKKFKNIDKVAPINIHIQEEFYNDYIGRLSFSKIWEDKYKYIANTQWVKERFLSDEQTNHHDKIIVKYFAGELTEEFCKDSNFGKLFYKAAFNNEIPPIDSGSESGVISDVDYAFIIANLLGKYEWFPIIQDRLKNATRLGWIINDGKNIIGPYNIDLSNKVFEAIIALLNKDIEKCKSLLEEYLIKVDLGFDPRVVIHHTLFQKLRESDGFEKWFKNLVHRFDIINPDPSFQTIDWWY